MCPFEYRDRCSLKRHKRGHFIKKPYCCDLCDRRFAVKKELANHIKHHTQKPRKKKYKCDLCKKAFAYPSHLTEHKFTHTGEKPHVCEHCGNRYRQRTSYVRHIRTIHEGDKPWVCKICSKAFVGKTDLRYHQWTHEERWSYFGVLRTLRPLLCCLYELRRRRGMSLWDLFQSRSLLTELIWGIISRHTRKVRSFCEHCELCGNCSSIAIWRTKKNWSTCKLCGSCYRQRTSYSKKFTLLRSLGKKYLL